MSDGSTSASTPSPQSPHPIVAAAFFDVDRTLVPGSSLLYMVRPLRKAGLIRISQVITAAMRQIWFTMHGASDRSLDQAAQVAATAFRGLDAATMETLAEQLVPTHLVPHVSAIARRTIAEHLAAGQRVYLVSSSPRQLIAPLGRHLGVNGVVATETEVINGRLTGRLSSFCAGIHKAEAIRDLAAAEGIDLAASHAYGDSVNDRHMLAVVGHPHAVNPDRRLRHIAQTRGWPVLSFRSPRRSEVSHRAAAGTRRLIARVARSGADGLG